MPTTTSTITNKPKLSHFNTFTCWQTIEFAQMLTSLTTKLLFQTLYTYILTSFTTCSPLKLFFSSTLSPISAIISLSFATIASSYLCLYLIRKNVSLLINFWTFVINLLILTTTTSSILANILKTNNLYINKITFLIIITSFTSLGLYSFYNSNCHHCIKTFFFIHNPVVTSVQLAKTFKKSHLFTCLILLCLWDLISMLSPFGPLKKILDQAYSQNNIHQIPGFVHVVSVDRQKLLTKYKQQSRKQKKQKTNNDLDKNIHKLANKSLTSKKQMHPLSAKLEIGIGDFLAYGFLQATVMTSNRNSNIHSVITIIIAILIGLFVTVTVSRIWKRPVPAITLPVLLGLIASNLDMGTKNKFLEKQVFI